MATPRHLLVDPVNECDYHLVSRCVRRAFLCGVDEFTGRDCSHRRDWLLERLHRLGACFAVDVYAFVAMSNHFHLALRHDPLAWRGWDDGEVAWRWFEAFPPTERGEVVEALKPERRELMLGDPKRLSRARRTLGSLSHFMKHLKQPVARRANLEDGCEGHFFEQRFYSGALLTEEALVAAMAYIDLNPVRAKLAKRIGDIRDASIAARLQVNSAEALADYLRPVVSGIEAHAPAGALPPPDEPLAWRIGDILEASAPEQFEADDAAAPADHPDLVIPGPDTDAITAIAPPSAVEPQAAPVTDPGEPESAGEAPDGAAREAERKLSAGPACPAAPLFDESRTASGDSRGQVEERNSVDTRTGTTPCPRANEPDDGDGDSRPGGERTRRRPLPGITLAAYIELVRGLVEAETGRTIETPGRVREWLARTKILRKKQRAFGPEPVLRRWIDDRDMQFRETPLPA